MPIARIGHGQETKDNSSHSMPRLLPSPLSPLCDRRASEPEPQLGLLRYSGAKLIGAAALRSREEGEGGLQEYVDEIGWIRNFCLHVKEVEYPYKNAL